MPLLVPSLHGRTRGEGVAVTIDRLVASALAGQDAWVISAVSARATDAEAAVWSAEVRETQRMRLGMRRVLPARPTQGAIVANVVATSLADLERGLLARACVEADPPTCGCCGFSPCMGKAEDEGEVNQQGGKKRTRDDV